MRPNHLTILSTLTLAVTLAGCDQQPEALAPVLDVPTALAPGGQFEDFTGLASSAICVTPPATLAGFDSYRPFDLPAGYAQAIVADEIGDFRPVAGTGGDLPDMMVLNETGPHAGRYMYRTHETGSNGAVTMTDMATGVTTLISQESHYESLDGIVWTPWHTLLFAEERIVATFDDPRVPNAVGGLVYEYDPRTGEVAPRPAVGARSHEGLRFDARGNLYGISESTPGVNGSGAIYRFTPDRRGDLSSGQLYALKVLDGVSKTGPAVWVPLDREDSEVNSDATAIAAGATGWARPEDVEINTNTGSTKGGNVMYVATTTDDLVLRIELDGDEAFVSNFVDKANTPGLDSPDNLALDNQGNLWVIEDNGPSDIFIARIDRANERRATIVERFASLSDCSAESTGFYFDRSSKTAYVHVQHAGGALRNDLMVAFTKE
jgi:hypothetical protein